MVGCTESRFRHTYKTVQNDYADGSLVRSYQKCEGCGKTRRKTRDFISLPHAY